MIQTQDLIQEALGIARIGCWEWNLQTEQLVCTDEVYGLFGLQDTVVRNSYQPFMELVQEKDMPLIRQAFEHALQNRQLTKTEFTITCPDGNRRILEVCGRVKEDIDNKVVRLIGTLQDISTSKQAERALLIREQQYHFMVESVPAMIWTAHSDDMKDYVNTWMVNYTGMSAGELLEEGWLKAVHPDDREKVIAAQAHALQFRQPYQLEIRFKRADGSYRWHIMRALPYKDTEGNLIKYIGINADIHDQKLKEEALRQNESLLEVQQKLTNEKEFSESILENSLSGILCFDRQGHITKWNKHMEFLSGMKKEQVLGKTLFDLFPQYRDGEEGKVIGQALRGEKVQIRRYSNLFGSEEKFYEINLMPLFADSKLAGGLGTIYEITEIIKLEEEQTRLKLEGQKEVLNAILRAQERERERIAESLYNGIGQYLFAIKLNLQTVSSTVPDPQMQAILSKVNDLLNESIRQSRTVSFELVPTILKDFGLGATLVDLAQNLSSPALLIQVQVEGMENRLERFLELTVYRIVGALLSNVLEHAKATEAIVKVEAEEQSILIEVSDNGTGFDPKTAIATVKENSLHTVSNRVALLNGKLTIESGRGKGTKIRVSLPVSK